jgi:DNA-binding IclR family transcriptional regulator
MTMTSRSIATRTELLRQLALVRRRGFAWSAEESEAGVSSLAAAVPTPFHPPPAFNVAVPTSRLTKAAKERIASALLDVTETARATLP